MNTTKIMSALLLSLLLFFTACKARAGTIEATPSAPNSFADCVAAGNLIQRTYPQKCETADGKVFYDETQKTGQAICKDMCGDGTCQEIVCQGVGCPCSETKVSCAKDCK